MSRQAGRVGLFLLSWCTWW